MFHDWCNKDRGVCHPVCGVQYITDHSIHTYIHTYGQHRYMNGPLIYVHRHITVLKCAECVVK